MSYKITHDPLSNYLDVRFDYGEFRGDIFPIEHTHDMHLRIVWRVTKHNGPFVKVKFEGEKRIPYRDLHAVAGYLREKDRIRYEIYRTFYGPIIDMVRTALFCAVLEKLHEAHSRGF